MTAISPSIRTSSTGSCIRPGWFTKSTTDVERGHPFRQRAARSHPCLKTRGAKHDASLLIVRSFRSCGQDVRAPLVLLNVIPMHPRIGLRAVASFEEHIFL